MTTLRPPRVLIIAGSDSAGGAGIQADIKAASALGVHALTVVTAVTSQNTKGVQAVHHIPLEHIRSQLASIADDIEFDAVKTGMLGSDEIAEVVAAFLKNRNLPVVVDPVLVSQSGGVLSTKNAFERLYELADIMTPNAEETSELTGFSINTLSDIEKAAEVLLKRTKRVLIKSGDSKIGFDFYSDGTRTECLTIDRIETVNTHGTGCTLATAIASFCAKGFNIYDAVVEARRFVRDSIKNGVPLGSCFGTVNATGEMLLEMEKHHMINELADAFSIMAVGKIGKLIPEIQSNLAYCLPGATSHKDVAAFPARIIRHADDIIASVAPRFGASRHIANVVLAAHRRFPLIRCAMAVRYCEEIVDCAIGAGLSVASFDRADEPVDIKEREGSSLDWGVTTSLNGRDDMVDIIFDRGGMGKEPIVRVLGRNPEDVAIKVLAMMKKFKNE